MLDSSISETSGGRGGEDGETDGHTCTSLQDTQHVRTQRKHELGRTSKMLYSCMLPRYTVWSYIGRRYTLSFEMSTTPVQIRLESNHTIKF